MKITKVLATILLCFIIGGCVLNTKYKNENAQLIPINEEIIVKNN